MCRCLADAGQFRSGGKISAVASLTGSFALTSWTAVIRPPAPLGGKLGGKIVKRGPDDRDRVRSARRIGDTVGTLCQGPSWRTRPAAYPGCASEAVRIPARQPSGSPVGCAAGRRNSHALEHLAVGRHVQDITATCPQPGRGRPALDGWDRAGMEAREALVHPAAALHSDTIGGRQPGVAAGSELARRLDAAALSLTCGRDLLRTHLLAGRVAGCGSVRSGGVSSPCRVPGARPAGRDGILRPPARAPGRSTWARRPGPAAAPELTGPSTAHVTGLRS